MQDFGADPEPLKFDGDEPDKVEEPVLDVESTDVDSEIMKKKQVIPPKQDEFLWAWKVRRFFTTTQLYLMIVLSSA